MKLGFVGGLCFGFGSLSLSGCSSHLPAHLFFQTLPFWHVPLVCFHMVAAPVNQNSFELFERLYSNKLQQNMGSNLMTKNMQVRLSLSQGSAELTPSSRLLSLLQGYFPFFKGVFPSYLKGRSWPKRLPLHLPRMGMAFYPIS